VDECFKIRDKLPFDHLIAEINKLYGLPMFNDSENCGKLKEDLPG